jgi:predicted ATPase/DNA-binding SARP family transcriptional activator
VIIRFGILGSIEIYDRSGRAVPIDGSRQLALLAFLLLHANSAVSSDDLIAAIWGDEAPAGGLKTLHVVIARLRRILHDADAGQPAALRTTRGGYLLELAAGALDAEVFERRVEAGRRALSGGDPARAAELLREAHALWRGPALADVAYESFAQSEIRRLEELRLAASEARFEADLQLGAHADVVTELEHAVARHPTRERLVGQLMTALYRAGRQAEALEAYGRTRTQLMAELGLRPGPALRELHQGILEHAPALALPADDAPEAPAVAAVDRVTARAPSVPTPLTDVLGREADLHAVVEMLRRDDVRHVTLTGIGGVGKTRLAIEVANRIAPRFAQGAAFVDLAALSDPDDAADVVLGALNVTPAPGTTATETLMHVIADREQLLVLDNFEHLLAGVALLAAMLDGAPGLKLLVTSRAALHLRAEHCYVLGPLDLPATHDPGAVSVAPATALFIARATAQGATIRLTSASAGAIATICARLDGLPLAIELAATRCGVRTPEEIARGLTRILPMLGSGASDAPERQRTLRSTLDWSYDLLSPADQLAFSQLSCFAGGFSLDALAAVCHDGDADQALETLARLVGASLIQVGQRGGRTRYRLLETVREYALDRLRASGEEEPARRRHMAHYLAMAEEAHAHLQGGDQADWLERLEGERDNLRAALGSALDFEDGTTSQRLAGALTWFWYLRGHYREGRELLHRALATNGPVSPAARAKALEGAGMLAFLMCEYDDASSLLIDSLTLYRELDDAGGVASALQVLGSVARERADYPTAVAYHEESLSLWRGMNHAKGVARSLNYLSFVAWLGNHHERARTLAMQTLAQFRELGDQEGIAWSLLNLAASALLRGDSSEVVTLSEDAAALSLDIGYKEGVAWSLNLLGLVRQREGDAARAAEYLTESLEGHVELGDRWRAAGLLEALAGLAAQQGEHGLAARLFGASDALREQIGAPVPTCDRAAHDRGLAAARAGADASDFAAAWSEGRAMSLKQAAAQARVLSSAA